MRNTTARELDRGSNNNPVTICFQLGDLALGGSKYCRLANRNVWSAASPQAKCEDVTSWSAQMYTAFVRLNHFTPGQDGMRCALFPISYAVLRDFFRLRV
jgi:hypothetical protein